MTDWSPETFTVAVEQWPKLPAVDRAQLREFASPEQLAKLDALAKSTPPNPRQLPPPAVPSQDLDAEAAYLSWVLLGGAIVPELRPDHMYAEANRRIYEAMLALRAAGEPLDTVTLAGKLRDTNRLKQVGGSWYLAALTDAVPAVAHPEAYVKRIIHCYRVRMTVNRLRDVALRVEIGDLDPAEVIAQLRAKPAVTAPSAAPAG